MVPQRAGLLVAGHAGQVALQHRGVFQIAGRVARIGRPHQHDVGHVEGHRVVARAGVVGDEQITALDQRLELRQIHPLGSGVDDAGCAGSHDALGDALLARADQQQDPAAQCALQQLSQAREVFRRPAFRGAETGARVQAHHQLIIHHSPFPQTRQPGVLVLRGKVQAAARLLRHVQAQIAAQLQVILLHRQGLVPVALALGFGPAGQKEAAQIAAVAIDMRHTGKLETEKGVGGVGQQQAHVGLQGREIGPQLPQAFEVLVAAVHDMIEPGAVFQNAPRIRAYAGSDDGVGEIRPQTLEHGRGHDDVADPVGTAHHQAFHRLQGRQHDCWRDLFRLNSGPACRRQLPSSCRRPSVHAPP